MYLSNRAKFAFPQVPVSLKVAELEDGQNSNLAISASARYLMPIPARGVAKCRNP